MLLKSDVDVNVIQGGPISIDPVYVDSVIHILFSYLPTEVVDTRPWPLLSSEDLPEQRVEEQAFHISAVSGNGRVPKWNPCGYGAHLYIV